MMDWGYLDILRKSTWNHYAKGITSLNSFITLVEPNEMRIALHVWAVLTGGNTGAAFLRPRGVTETFLGTANTGFCLARAAQLSVPDGTGTLTAGGLGALAFNDPNESTVTLTDTATLTTSIITQNDAVSGTIDPITGAVSETITRGDAAATTAETSAVAGTIETVMGPAVITFPTFTFAPSGGVAGGYLTQQFPFRLNLRDDGALVRMAFDVVVSGQSHVFHVIECIAQK